MPLGFSASQQVSPALPHLPASLSLSGDLTWASPSHGFEAGAYLSVSEIDVGTREGANVKLAKEHNRIYGNRWLAPQPEQ